LYMCLIVASGGALEWWIVPVFGIAASLLLFQLDILWVFWRWYRRVDIIFFSFYFPCLAFLLLSSRLFLSMSMLTSCLFYTLRLW
jgi:hypothetical protein